MKYYMVQIEYTNKDGENVESLFKFDNDSLLEAVVGLTRELQRRAEVGGTLRIELIEEKA